MKTFRATSGPFIERPYFKTEEIESMCSDELQKAGLMPSEPEPIRVDRFIEKRFKIQVTYNEELPEGVLGCIEFGSKGVRGIQISRSLAEDRRRVSERRVSTTLAHESGHGLLHAHLFAFGEKPASLFDDDKSKEPKILCRDGAVLGVNGNRNTGYGGQWWEYQANLVIGSLLLPRSLATKALDPFIIKIGSMGTRRIVSGKRGEAEKHLSQIFDVNPIVARIRLEGLFPVGDEKQLTF